MRISARRTFLRKYRAIRVVGWRVNFPSGAPANFAGLLGSSARKTVQWTVFSENGLASPGGKSRKLQDVHGGKGTARHAARLCGISLSALPKRLSQNGHNPLNSMQRWLGGHRYICLPPCSAPAVRLSPRSASPRIPRWRWRDSGSG